MTTAYFDYATPSAFQSERDRALHAETRLSKAAEFRETFLGLVSHDLRMLLGVITGTVRVLLASERLDGRDEDRVSRISRAAGQMNRMIRDLLDLTRGRLGGGIPIVTKPVDLGIVCASVLDEIRGARPDREFQLATLGRLYGEWDEDRLGQAIMNLCSNADDYGDPATPVRVSVSGNDESVEVVVENEGDPVSPDDVERMFEPYTRASPRRGGAGLGLGLFIVREIARAHGGNVSARPQDGHIAFVLRLPRRPPSQPAS